MPADPAGPPPPGLILAGGRASRLGGGDKALRPIGGRTILSRIVERLGPQCDGLVLSANGPADRFSGWQGPVVADHPEDAGCGPLAGLLAGLDWVAAQRPLAGALLTVPSDTPFLPSDLVERLMAARPPHGIAFARSDGRDHGLAALWPVALAPLLRQQLRGDGRRRVSDLLARQGAVAVAWPEVPIDPFFNVNTPEDAAVAERWATRA